MFQPESITDLEAWILAQVENRSPLVWRQPWLATADPEGEPRTFSLEKLDQVVDYPHRDMTVTVQCGLPLQRLREILAEQGQHLPLDVPHPERMTIAELICGNWFGSQVAGGGTVRDWLLGLTAIDGRGRLFHSGGRVVKNVAGYDVHKLIIGSQGDLAVPLEASFKVMPEPESRLLKRFRAKSFSVLQNCWKTIRTLPFDPSLFDVTTNRELLVGVEGLEESNQELMKQIEESLAEISEVEATAEMETTFPSHWEEILQQVEGNSEPSCAMRLGVRPSQTVDALQWADKWRAHGIGHASRGAVTVTGSISAVSDPKEFFRELEQLNANWQFLLDPGGWRQSGLSVMHEKKKATAQFSEEFRDLFDPHRLLQANAEQM